jgi:hypothetical protein
LAAEGVRQDKRVEPVIFGRGDAVAFQRSGSDARRHREDGLAAGVQCSTRIFGALDRDQQSCAVQGERGVELGHTLDIASDALLRHPPPRFTNSRPRPSRRNH